MKWAVSILFFLQSLVFLAVKGQNAPGIGLNFHSDFEETAIKDFLEKKNVDIFTLQMVAGSEVTERELQNYSQMLDSFIDKLKEKRSKYANDKRFLSYMFYKVNQKFLKKYETFTSLEQVFSTGQYNCLSGVALYAIMLDRMKIEYDIVETTYHIYIRINSNSEIFLMESTDPQYGFISDANEVANRLKGYNADGDNQQAKHEGKKTYSFETRLHDSIDLYNLVGLHYYNAAVNAFNREDISASIDNLEKAAVFYYSPRITEFGGLVAKTLLSVEDISNDSKSDYLNRINGVLSTERTYATR